MDVCLNKITGYFIVLCLNVNEESDFDDRQNLTFALDFRET